MKREEHHLRQRILTIMERGLWDATVEAEIIGSGRTSRWLTRFCDDLERLFECRYPASYGGTDTWGVLCANSKRKTHFCVAPMASDWYRVFELRGDSLYPADFVPRKRGEDSSVKPTAALLTANSRAWVAHLPALHDETEQSILHALASDLASDLRRPTLLRWLFGLRIHGATVLGDAEVLISVFAEYLGYNIVRIHLDEALRSDRGG